MLDETTACLLARYLRNRPILCMSACTSACTSSCLCRFISPRVIRRERRADGADQRAAPPCSDAAYPHRGVGAELRGVQAICRRPEISTH